MSQPLNIILLMADQWRWDTVFRPGHVCRTPQLDRFAERAQPFTNAFTCCPLCTPARGALMTGKWPHQNHLMDNVSGGSYHPHGKLHMSHRTYLERLRDDAGYALAYCGKWHLGDATLHERGIHNVRHSDGGAPEHGTTPSRPNRPKLQGEWFTPFYASFTEGDTLDAVRARAFRQQLAQLAAGDEPFCAMLSFSGPHFPHTVPRRFLEPYSDTSPGSMPTNYCTPFCEPGKPVAQSRPYWPCQDTRGLTPDDWAKTCAHYWAFCTHLDDELGAVFGTIGELGLWENSVVAFFADHGEMLGAHGNFDKGPYFYDEVVRIPLIVADPAGRPPRDAGSFVGLRDLFPTLIDLAGASHLLADAERTRSGWRTAHDAALITYDAYQGREFKLRGIRTERWKYTWSPNDLCELYDLADDPGERRNRIGEPACQPITQRLHTRLRNWMAAEDDVLLHARHLLPVGAYADGRGVEEQHDHGTRPPTRGHGPA